MPFLPDYAQEFYEKNPNIQSQVRIHMRWFLLAVPVLAVLMTTAAFSQQQIIPEWVRNSALWWAQGLISDAEFMGSIQWLIDNGIIKLGNDGQIVKETYTIMHPVGWDRQVPVMGEDGSMRDAMVALATIDEVIPVTIAVSTSPMQGETLEAHREWGLALINEFLGDAFDHTRTEQQMVAGKPGYVDEYIVEVFAFTIQGKSYSFEHMGDVYEIKYEADPKYYDTYLSEFERVVKTFQLR